jgi:VIT1/CCC1 family predicted Fe2+/Mn2+ transporter
MKHPIKVGVSFGLTSGVITTLGLVVGLHASTHSIATIIGGILIIAVADSLSDATGIHISEESEQKHSTKDIWHSTLSTFFTKISLALTFIIPLLLFKLITAVIISIIWGLLVIALFSYYITYKQKKTKPWKAITEHLAITIAVIIITHFVGKWIPTLFG